jgi:transcriptional regulator with XRE-family HTH domain
MSGVFPLIRGRLFCILKEVETMNNPIVTIRQEKNLKVSELAILSRLSTMTIQRIERGNLQTINPKLLDTIEQMGYDRKKVAADYEKWKELRLKQLQEQLG